MSGNTVYTIKQNAKAEIVEKKSRFISFAIKTETETDALSELEKVKTMYPDATHHTYAYVINDNGVLYQRYSDDKEPSGTAGLPILEVLKKNNIENVLIIVVRYFGGTLLGTGGLARAYSQSAKEAVEQAGLARRVDCAVFILTTDYSSYEKLKRIMEEHTVMDVKFTEQVIVRFAAEDLKAEEQIGKIYELVNNKCIIERENNIYLEI
ncbi:MAG: YigZ family protein [Clostridia bacterium]|nr:YigZ family protein [Clostridia bacterium]MDD4501494.1 YigZ family protein [Clostridia bacterium]HPB16690.1 YigZ family protein [Clostridia bacterium]HQM95530.1 YigZ family protein [Clostridia bacterium]HQO69693.1 YigZ family protein [Clostridia bacterium]